MSDQNTWYNDLYTQSLAAYKNNDNTRLKLFLEQSQKSQDEFLDCVQQTASILAVDGFVEAANFLLKCAQPMSNQSFSKSMRP